MPFKYMYLFTKEVTEPSNATCYKQFMLNLMTMNVGHLASAVLQEGECLEDIMY